MRYYQYIWLLIFYSFSMSLIGQETDSIPSKLELKGYVKGMQSTLFMGDIDDNASASLLHNRLNFKYNISTNWTARLEIRNRVFFGEQVKLTPDFSQLLRQNNELFNLSKVWIDEKSLVAHSEIDRFLINYADDNWNITLGRQRINWGINNVWNPNDIFNAYNFLDFDYEERPGNDAIRIERNIKDNASLELAYKPGKTKDQHTAAFLYKFNKWKYDFQVLAGIYNNDYVIGGGWAGSIKNAGFKGEWSYFIPKENTLNFKESFSISLMADQTFKHDWYVSVSALYNSNPTNFSLFSGSLFNSQLSAKTLFPFRYNFHSMVMKTISPISTVSCSFIYSPEKNTLIVVPTYLWNVANNFDLDFTAQSFFAKENTSYNNLATQVFVRGRWSF